MNISEAQYTARQFGINGQCSIFKEAAKIQCEQGVKCIKKANYGIERLMFIYEVKEYLVKNGFSFVDRFLKTPEGNPYTIYNNEIFVLTDWIDGRECDFDSITDVKTAVEILAKFHHHALGFIASDGTKIRSELGRLPITLRKRSEELLKLKKIAKKGKDRFDYLYMENVDFFIEKSLNSLKAIDSPVYERLIQKAQKNGELCHRDYSYHNLIFSKESRIHIVNFDYCCHEIKVYDIVSFLRKIMSECNWNVEVAMSVINWYDTINKLDQDEIDIIVGLMEYPQKFWRIANRYYNSRRTRPERGFYNKLSDVVSEKEFFIDFLDKFKQYSAAGIGR